MEEYTETETQEVSRPEKVIKTTKKVDSGVRTEHPQKVYEKKKVIFRTYQIVWYALGVVEVLLLFRFMLKALGANPFSGFVSFIYALSDPLAIPFQGILPTVVSGTGPLFEWSTLVAALVYAIIASGIVQLMQLVKPVTPHEVDDMV